MNSNAQYVTIRHNRSVRLRYARDVWGLKAPNRHRRVFSFVAIVFLGLAGCGEDAPPKIMPALPVRPVRVLLYDDLDSLSLRVDGRYAVRDLANGIIAEDDDLPWTEVTKADGLKLGEVATANQLLSIESLDGMGVHLRGTEGDDATEGRYAGRIVVMIESDGRFRVLNEVDIEAYVAGVVAREAWPSFHIEALKAQAIASRTYALYLMSRRHNRAYDLRSGEGAQVYRGMRVDGFGRSVVAAVDATRGLVLTHATSDGPRVFCAYYSAACGGRSQSYADVRNESAPAPLRGNVECDYCKIAKGKAYRWGPEEVKKSDLLKRLQRRDKGMRDWKKLDKVSVHRKTRYGRVKEILLTSGTGKTAQMGGERFRLAVGSRVMRSTDCTVVDGKDTIRLENGKGFGHGLGLCQWGAEGQAREGRYAGVILRHYYPGAAITRAY